MGLADLPPSWLVGSLGLVLDIPLLYYFLSLLLIFFGIGGVKSILFKMAKSVQGIEKRTVHVLLPIQRKAFKHWIRQKKRRRIILETAVNAGKQKMHRYEWAELDKAMWGGHQPRLAVVVDFKSGFLLTAEIDYKEGRHQADMQEIAGVFFLQLAMHGVFLKESRSELVELLRRESPAALPHFENVDAKGGLFPDKTYFEDFSSDEDLEEQLEKKGKDKKKNERPGYPARRPSTISNQSRHSTDSNGSERHTPNRIVFDTASPHSSEEDLAVDLSLQRKEAGRRSTPIAFA
mmetsp:Transcript_38452/g.98933  ORF Transcript_38452/g.98933 Transcript_38452/m.98933 type:complete len:291 (-) Transcript_38452:102-974(-)